MRTRSVAAVALAALLMAGVAWTPPAEAGGGRYYRYGNYSPRFSTIIPFGYSRYRVISPYVYRPYTYSPYPYAYPRVYPYPSGYGRGYPSGYGRGYRYR